MVSTWNDDEGWGVLVSERTPTGCWCHFSSLAMQGWGTLAPGTSVEFLFEEVEQDGFSYRALEAWPVGLRHRPASFEGVGEVYLSRLIVHLDADDGTD